MTAFLAAHDAAMSADEEDMPGLVGLTGKPAPLIAPTAPLIAPTGPGLDAGAAARKKHAQKQLQQERDAVSANALAQMSVLASQREATAADAKEKALVNALTLDSAPPNASSSEVWMTFRKYSVHKREEFAVCLCCKESGKSNWDSEVKYGASHSTSKLLQHIVSCHKEEHKRKLESVVEEQRKAGTTLLAALNVSPGVAAVDNYLEWIALGCLPVGC